MEKRIAFSNNSRLVKGNYSRITYNGCLHKALALRISESMGSQWVLSDATVVKDPLRGHRNKLIMYEGFSSIPCNCSSQGYTYDLQKQI